MIKNRKITQIAVFFLMLISIAILHWLGFSSYQPGLNALSAGPRPVPAELKSELIESFTVTAARIAPLSREAAVAANLSVPFSTAPNPPAEPYHFNGTEEDLARATGCLAAAQFYEAGGDVDGQRAVAQVVINRLRHPAFPKTVCGVVFQGAERTTGCQFTFTCDGAMARVPSTRAWQNANKIALQALNGAVFVPVGYATHYHTDWVVPYWSATLDKLVAIQTHIFYRFPGTTAHVRAYNFNDRASEPLIAMLSAVSAAHRAPLLPMKIDALHDIFNDSESDRVAFQSATVGLKEETIDHEIPDVKVIARLEKSNIFILQLPDDLDSARFAEVGRKLCKAYNECSIMAWKGDGHAPSSFPLPKGAISTMAFNYVQDSKNGSHRSFWNCNIFPVPDGGRCI